MTCFHPVKATQTFAKKSNGKYGIIFGQYDPAQGNLIELPCGQCIGCRLEYSKQWAIRCYHESTLYEKNSFITLTYDEYHLPSDGSIDLRHFQLFMKKLRKEVVPKNPYNKETQPEKYEEFRDKHAIRFFHCGEYGEQCRNCGLAKRLCTCVKYIPGLGRPHYHACIFNYDFTDKVIYSDTNGEFLYTSELLNSKWEMGQCWIGEVTFESAAYVARYITKKINGDAAPDHYEKYDNSTDQSFQVKPEYVTMSRRPHGIGKNWLASYQADVYPHDYVIINGKKVKPPKYYDTVYEIGHPESLNEIKEKRKTDSLKHSDNTTDARLKVREKITQLRFKKLKRDKHD